MDTDVSGTEVPTKDNNSPAFVDSSDDLRNLSKRVLDSVKLEPDSIQRLVDQADELVQPTPKRAAARKRAPLTGPKARHNEQVREWLRNCNQNADYSTVGGNCCIILTGSDEFSYIMR